MAKKQKTKRKHNSKKVSFANKTSLNTLKTEFKLPPVPCFHAYKCTAVHLLINISACISTGNQICLDYFHVYIKMVDVINVPTKTCLIY